MAKETGVLLIVPDYPDRSYIRDMAHLILVQLGFKKLSVQQESICSSYGASIAHGCVVDIGAMKTSVSCIEEGLVLSETRLALDYGGDDISELYLRLLERINLPYRSVDLNRTYYWTMIEDLKTRSASLAEEDVVLIDYDILLRQPGQATQKYALKTYDEPNVAAMLLFDPSVLDFAAKGSLELRNSWAWPNVEDMDVWGDVLTRAMWLATAHIGAEREAKRAADTTAEPVVEDVEMEAPTVVVDPTPMSLPFVVDAESSFDPPPESNPPPTTTTTVPTATNPSQSARSAKEEYNSRFEASKTPLDLAIFHSIQACMHHAGTGGPDRVKKMLSCILVVGGSALIPGMLAALDTRLRGLFAANMEGHEEHVAIIPAPKSIDPRVLAWKGGSVLAKLETASDLWLQAGDWEMMGMRALRDRSFFL
ncbi:actin-like ATPase domain-containing protein [Clavulina sp. PMI_390]|nr:actin-like ATPase domain-containing protein [Clavulina sp. PMI_390]